MDNFSVILMLMPLCYKFKPVSLIYGRELMRAVLVNWFNKSNFVIFKTQNKRIVHLVAFPKIKVKLYVCLLYGIFLVFILSRDYSFAEKKVEEKTWALGATLNAFA